MKVCYEVQAGVNQLPPMAKARPAAQDKPQVKEKVLMSIG